MATPKKKTTTTPKKKAEKKPVTAGGKKHILIVEDERPLAHALELKLASSGYDITSAATGSDGVKAAKAGKFNLILLDLILPGIDGFTVLEELHKAKIKTPVIILSNLGQEEDKAKTSKYGVVHYCVKANTPLSSIIDLVKSTAK